jgi:Uncharacterized protein conserved in bacteria
MTESAIFGLLPRWLAAAITFVPCEIRIRVGKPVTVFDGVRFSKLIESGKPLIASVCDIEHVLGVASGWSRYAIDDDLARGFVRYDGGIRIGASGEGVTKNGGLTTLKKISSLVIRVPQEVKGCADGVIDKVLKDGFNNTLIISPPAGGKTTMLREIARLASNGGLNTTVIDERFELAASVNGSPTLDVGINTDVLSGVPKTLAYENAVRSLNPDVIVTDEVYSADEVQSITRAVRAGVKIAASLHADNEQILEEEVFKPLSKIVEVIVVLCKKNRAGEIAKVICRD